MMPNLVEVHSPKMRMAVGTFIRTGNLDVARAQHVAGVIVRSVARQTAKDMGISYDPKDPMLVAVSQDAVVNLVGYLSATNKESRKAVQSILPRGLHPSERALRLDAARGLDTRSAYSLEKYRQTITAGKKPPYGATVERSVARLRTHYLNVRSNRIANYETSRLVSAAIEAQIRSAIFAQEIPLATYKMWDTQRDGCPVCQELNGKKVLIGSQWSTPYGLVDYPPAHPNCRCTMKVEA